MIQIVKNPDDKRKFQTFNNRKNSSFNENTELNAIPQLTTPELVQPECSRTERPTSIVKERSTLKKGRIVYPARTMTHRGFIYNSPRHSTLQRNEPRAKIGPRLSKHNRTKSHVGLSPITKHRHT